MGKLIILIEAMAKKKKTHTSISALGVRADTESTQIRSTAPDLHIRSATEICKDVSPYTLSIGA
jgi:hypothetical protein